MFKKKNAHRPFLEWKKKDVLADIWEKQNNNNKKKTSSIKCNVNFKEN